MSPTRSSRVTSFFPFRRDVGLCPTMSHDPDISMLSRNRKKVGTRPFHVIGPAYRAHESQRQLKILAWWALFVGGCSPFFNLFSFESISFKRKADLLRIKPPFPRYFSCNGLRHMNIGNDLRGMALSVDFFLHGTFFHPKTNRFLSAGMRNPYRHSFFCSVEWRPASWGCWSTWLLDRWSGRAPPSGRGPKMNQNQHRKRSTGRLLTALFGQGLPGSAKEQKRSISVILDNYLDDLDIDKRLRQVRRWGKPSQLENSDSGFWLRIFEEINLV